VGFIAAGCFFAAGGDIKALSKTIVGMIYGAIVAWIALLIIAKVPVPGLGTVWPAIVVGVTVFFLVIVAFHRSAVLRAGQCLWLCRAGGLHVVSGKSGRAYGHRQLKSAIPHCSLCHLGRRAWLPYGPIDRGTEASTWAGGYYGSNQHLKLFPV
jgi:hypothetical protein